MILTTFPKNIVHVVLGVVSLGGLQLERVIGLLIGVEVAWQLVWPVDGLLHVPTCKIMTKYQIIKEKATLRRRLIYPIQLSDLPMISSVDLPTGEAGGGKGANNQES